LSNEAHLACYQCNVLELGKFNQQGKSKRINLEAWKMEVEALEVAANLVA
jgi:hypothetical protein